MAVGSREMVFSQAFVGLRLGILFLGIAIVLGRSVLGWESWQMLQGVVAPKDGKSSEISSNVSDCFVDRLF